MIVKIDGVPFLRLAELVTFLESPGNILKKEDFPENHQSTLKKEGSLGLRGKKYGQQDIRVVFLKSVNPAPDNSVVEIHLEIVHDIDFMGYDPGSGSGYRCYASLNVPDVYLRKVYQILAGRHEIYKQ